MSVKYIRFTVQVHGLNLAKESDAESLRIAIKGAVESVHPAGESNIYDNDVSVEVDEFAGRFDTEDVPQPAVPDKDYKALYCELLYQVSTKHPGETSHETALRYIREAEDRGRDLSAAKEE